MIYEWCHHLSSSLHIASSYSYVVFGLLSFAKQNEMKGKKQNENLSFAISILQIISIFPFANYRFSFHYLSFCFVLQITVSLVFLQVF